MLVTDCIADPVPNTDINVDNWLIPDVTLADPEFHLSRPVDMLLGVTVLMEILKSGSHQISPHLPHLQNTQFGWIVGGSVTKMNETNKINQFINESTQNYLSRTWSEEENKSELLFQETTTRDHTGRFIIRLPLKDNYNQLGESRNLALNRFLKLELRFEKDPVLHKQYNEFMYNYLEMGHMEMVPNNDLNLDQPHFYFPHHPVLRPDSSSTKLRTVFNGSASTSSGLSLNDVLLTGPTIQKDIFDILLRFRCHKYVLTGDIQKMFRQIMVHSDDRNFQLILWRFSTEEAVQTYRLNTVTYGTCSASFIAARCLHQLGIEFQQRYPEAGKIVLNDFYMDDVVTGHEDKVKLLRLKQELEVILTSAGFELHKWKSNEKSIVSNSGEDEVSKILGILWNTGSDSISFGTQIDQQAGTTKRNILSEVQKIFDPLGIVSPIVILGKIIMQDIWSVKINWDDELPVHIISEWKRFCNQLKELERIEFPRHVRSQGKIVEIHGFSDAAKRAYGAAVYIRTVNGDDKVSVSLLCAKSRVTPTRESGNLDDMTIPRMELRAASLMVELTTKVIESLSIPIDGVHY
ncbi:uncharacterized protein LOC129742175 [Uranotaenia lowii]|uniref:uncharacterized protein LOC129742175 n=1 Tax=Uranotaenia lowii TaxID=190385 RepID=UPI002478954D|nr:uncharacterized protein LOC129742175 [Uranotaenia lowii]